MQAARQRCKVQHKRTHIKYPQLHKRLIKNSPTVQKTDGEFCYSLFGPQLSDERAAEDQHCAEHLHAAELFAEKQRRNYERRERFEIAHKRRRLRGERLKRGKIQIIRKPRVHKADDEHIGEVGGCGNDGERNAACKQVDHDDDKRDEKLVGGAVQSRHMPDVFRCDDEDRVQQPRAHTEQQPRACVRARVNAAGDADHAESDRGYCEKPYPSEFFLEYEGA